MPKQKATGWKVPLIFCALIITIVCIAHPFIGKSTKPAPDILPPELYAQAKALVIDLDADEEGRTWKSRITAAASGFGDVREKDLQLCRLALSAVEKGRFDAACTASVLVREVQQRDALRQDIADFAARECSTLPWAVMGAHGIENTALHLATNKALQTRWQECSSR
ncbi:MAG: GTP cyclohydrolase [Desulfovibrionaceae bacterium]|nr:GTP cyclohydrolase [Desulfovibrionaceae bacterium]